MSISSGTIAEAATSLSDAINESGQANAAAIESGIMTLAESIKYAADAYLLGEKLKFLERNEDRYEDETIEKLFDELGLPMPDATEDYQDFHFQDSQDIPF